MQNDIHALPCLRYERQEKKPMPATYPENQTTNGDHIRKKRMELKLFQRKVADMLGTDEMSINNWEVNSCMPQIRYFPRIISFLGYEPFD